MEVASFDALTNISFGFDEPGPLDKNTGPSLADDVILSASVAAESSRCSQGWAGLVEGIAPGCLGQCQSRGICRGISAVVSTWTKTHDKRQVKRSVCENSYPFECLLWDQHRSKCKKLLEKGPQFGMPTSVWELKRSCR